MQCVDRPIHSSVEFLDYFNETLHTAYLIIPFCAPRNEISRCLFIDYKRKCHLSHKWEQIQTNTNKPYVVQLSSLVVTGYTRRD